MRGYLKELSDTRPSGRRSIRKGFRRIAVMLIFLLTVGMTAFVCTGNRAQASGDLDRIRDYEITAVVNPDATVNMTFHIDWEVLDSDSEGPLSWVLIGIPNKHVESLQALSDNIDDIRYDSDNGSNVRIAFDREYEEGEVVSFEYSLVQDYLYEMNRLADGETVYDYTPGWFDGAAVDQLVIRWNSDKAESWSPSCEMEGSDLVWKTSLGKGDRYSIQITYPNDAFAFDDSKMASSAEDDDWTPSDTIFALIGLCVFLGPILLPILGVIAAAAHYGATACFGDAKKTKITRTKIVYYPNCPGCGAARPEGKDNCEYCGRSFIKSEEKIEEKDIPKEESEVRGKKTDGLYRYASSPDTYVRVHVVNVPVFTGSSHSYSSRSSGSSQSSCAHSSCACACACACAGGGRAGCTTKDFYRTDLKLRSFARSAGQGRSRADIDTAQ